MDDDYAGAAVGVLALIGVALTVIFGIIWAVVWLVKAAAWVFMSFWPWLLAAGVIFGAAWWLWLISSRQRERQRLNHRRQRAVHQMDAIYDDTRERMRRATQRHKQQW